MLIRPMIECVRYSVEWVAALRVFLDELERAGEAAFFSPHPADEKTLHDLAIKPTADVYCLLVEEQRVVGYGLLRGWDEGFEIPSLGIAVHPQHRCEGLGNLLMGYLEFLAARRGATSVRLRVFRQNTAAIALYSTRGYEWMADPGDGDLLVGHKHLRAGAIDV